MRMPMPDDPAPRMRHAPVSALLRPALLTLILVALAAPVRAQTSAPPVAGSSSAGAATNPVRVAVFLVLPIFSENKPPLVRLPAVALTDTPSLTPFPTHLTHSRYTPH